ncbi:cohesin domain-containing protein [Chloroflexota bacterium]
MKSRATFLRISVLILVLSMVWLIMPTTTEAETSPAFAENSSLVNFDSFSQAFSSEAPPPEVPGDSLSEPLLPPVTLTLNGPTAANPGETFSLHVIAQEVAEPGLYGVQFEIDYDPAFVSAGSLQLNPNLSFVVLSSADNANGKIRLVASQQGKVPGLTGNVTLLSFEATAADTPGTVVFTFADEKFSDAQAQGFEVLSQNHSLSIEATATPEPTEEPTSEPTPEPTSEPTEEPTSEPTPEPTQEPTTEPTEEPTLEPTSEPTSEPTEEPVPEPTSEPTEEPTPEPTQEPTPEPTVEPAAAKVSGQVILAGRAGNDWSGATVTIGDAVGRSGEGQFGVTNSTGEFSIAEASVGSLNAITADAPGYLSAVCASPVVTAPETALNAVNLLSGDINDDDLVDITDAAAVGTSFGQTGPDLPADITRDEVLDIFDIVLVSVNFGEEGPQPWDCVMK